jgi:two-component system, response regulator YesN
LLKVLIVDDELLVRIGLKSTLNWEEYGYELVGEARNSKEAFELFDKYHPDILLTDISMPGINGLELIKQLKSRDPKLQSIILTHFEDFSYAREAVSLGVLDYILKSNLTPERLLDVLAKAGQNDMRYPGSSISSSSVPLASDDLRHLLFSDDPDSSDFRDTTARFARQLPFSHYQIASIHINLNLAEQVMLDERKKNTLMEIASQVMAENPFFVLFTLVRNEFCFLFNFQANGSLQATKELIIQLLRNLSINIRKYLNFYLLIGISSVSDTAAGVRILHREAVEAGKRAFFLPEHLSVHESGTADGDSAKIEVDRERFLNLLEKRDKDQLMAALENLFGQSYQQKNLEVLKQLFSDLLECIKNFVRKEQGRQHAPNINAAMLEQDNFYNVYDFTAVKMYIVNLYTLVLDTEQSDDTVQKSYIIRKAMRYIEKNYKKNISLSNLAEDVEVSRSYLSFLFKQELGLNFSHYLTRMRIESAKEMLAGTNMKIYEIADEVGFDSPYYFSKVFKEFTGVTCKEFRNKHYGEN